MEENWRPGRVIDPSVLVLGYGNPGRADDGLGPAAAEAIEELALTGVRTSANYQLMIEDASDAAERDVVVFIDASKSGPEPFSVRAVFPGPEVACFASHFVRPELIMSLSCQVYGSCPRAFLVGIRGYDFSFFNGLTERAQENLQHAVSYVTEVLIGRCGPSRFS